LAGTWVQAGYWKDTSTLFEHTLNVTKNNYTIEGNLGSLYANQGDYERALPHFANAVRIRPDLADLHASYGSVLFMVGKVDEAVEQFTAALKIDPKLETTRRDLESAKEKQSEAKGPDKGKLYTALALMNQGTALDACGKPDEAMIKFQEAVRIKPDLAEAHCNLAVALKGQGKLDAAIAQCRKAITLKPDLGQAHNIMAVLLYMNQDFAGAWREVCASRKCGFEPNQEFVQALSQSMPDSHN
jgi:tetratricopeptide (TPR) repeat protein